MRCEDCAFFKLESPTLCKQVACEVFKHEGKKTEIVETLRKESQSSPVLTSITGG